MRRCCHELRYAHRGLLHDYTGIDPSLEYTGPLSDCQRVGEPALGSMKVPAQSTLLLHVPQRENNER